jgi:hypothetical protein
MRKYCTIIGLLLVVVLSVCAQNWTPQDSLRLRRLLDGEGEIKLNPEVLKEMGVQEPLGINGETMAGFQHNTSRNTKYTEEESCSYLAPVYCNYEVQLGPGVSEEN